MSRSADAFDCPPGRVPPARGNGAPPLDAQVVVDPDQPAECTLYPVFSPDHELMTNWITAHEGSFVALEDCR